MAFEKSRYKDGEPLFEVPYWRRVVENVQRSAGTFSYDDQLKDNQRFKQNEVGLKHPKNESFVRIQDNGTIELFSGEGTGIRLGASGVQLFGDNIQQIAREAQMVTGPNTTNINNAPLAGTYPITKYKGMTDQLKDELKEASPHVD